MHSHSNVRLKRPSSQCIYKCIFHIMPAIKNSFETLFIAAHDTQIRSLVQKVFSSSIVLILFCFSHYIDYVLSKNRIAWSTSIKFFFLLCLIDRFMTKFSWSAFDIYLLWMQNNLKDKQIHALKRYIYMKSRQHVSHVTIERPLNGLAQRFFISN